MTLVQCRNCGLVYLNPRPTAVAKTYYEEEYFVEKYKALYGVTYLEDRENITRIARLRLDLIEQYKPRGKLLDVGCAAGFFLDEARRRGWLPKGVEVSQFASEYARQKLGLDVFTGTLEAAGFPSEEFDVVVSYYVLLHLSDPLGLLREVHRILKPGGLLCVAVPNVQSLHFWLNRRAWIAERLLLNGYFYEFSPRTLRRLLETANFQTLSLRTEGRHSRRPLLAPVVRRLLLGNVLVVHALKKAGALCGLEGVGHRQ
jgi:SAM-dependent methyltransferase